MKIKYILYCDALPLMPLRKQFIPRKYYSLLKLFRLSILLATQNEICWKTSECNYPQWGAADAEIKVPSGEDTELKRSPLKAWSKSVYSHTSYAYCQGFLPCLFLPFRSIRLHFLLQNLSRVFLCWVWLACASCVGPQNKIGHSARGRFPRWVPTEYR